MLFKKLDRTYIIDIFRLLKWSVIVQLLQLAGTYILTLYFQKEHFGALSFLISTSIVFEMAAGMQYNTAAIVNESHRSARVLMVLSACIAVCVCLVLMLIILFLYFFEPAAFNAVNKYGLISTLPILIITNYIFNNGITILKYFGKIKEINFFRIFYVISMLSTKLVAAFIWGTLNSLIYAHLIGILLPCIYFLSRFRHQIQSTFRQINYQHAVQLLRSNYRFPKYSILSNIISAAATISFPIFITLFFGLHNNGIFYLTTVFIFQPLLLILQATGDAFLPKLKVMFYENKQLVFEFIKEQQKAILKFLIPYLLLAIIAGEYLFSYLLPSSWLEIGKFIKYIALYYLLTSIYVPFSIVADYMKQQRFLLIFNLSLFLFQFAILYFLQSKFDFTFVILIISIITTLYYGFINFYMLRKLKLEK